MGFALEFLKKEHPADFLQLDDYNLEFVCDLMEGYAEYVLKNRQCMYCEKTVEYSSGIFTCKDCSK